MKKFLLKLGISAIIISLGVYLLNTLYLHMNEVEYSEISKFYHVPKHIDICNLGSSHGRYGFNYSDFDELSCFNFGLSSQYPEYDYIILNHFKDSIDENSIVIMPISYFSFYGEDWEDYIYFLSRNKRYYRFLYPSEIIGWSLDQAIIEGIPVWTQYGRLIAVLIGGYKETIELDQVDCTQTALEINLEEDVIKTVDSQIGDIRRSDDGELIINEKRVNSIYNIAWLCKNRGARCIFVTTPFMDEYNEYVKKIDPDFQEKFHKKIDELIEGTGCDYYDYSHDERFVHSYEYFWNGDHLNTAGAKKFTSIVLDEIY